MAIIDHWHPAGQVSTLQKQPAKITIDDRLIAVFGTSTGQFGAVDDVCVHRRMGLSRGEVIGDRLHCCYHGWSYDVCGRGESPGTPKLEAQTRHYETRVAHDWVWVREAGANTPFPEFDVDGFVRIGEMSYDFDLPFELVLDNFTEAEHTGPVHVYFGFPTERMHEVTVKLDVQPDKISVVNYGPQKSFSWFYRLLQGITKEYYLIDDWTTHFAPLYCVYNFRYDHPKTRRPGLLHQRAVFFFVPESANRTRVIVFLYFKYDWWMAKYIQSWFYPLARRRFHDEIVRDQELLKGITDLDPNLEGMKLSRFDRVLGLNRERIERFYRNRDDSHVKLTNRRPLATISNLTCRSV